MPGGHFGERASRRMGQTGNHVYENNTLPFFNHPEGYIESNGSGGYYYVYQYKDHLGNTRLSYSDSDGNGSISASTEIIEENNYYPFALKHMGYNGVVNSTNIGQNFSDEQELIMMGGRQVNSRAYLSRFNFSGSEQNKKVNMLSGGERNRLHLAMTLKEEGNVLLLGEPTNDLDVNTLRALEEGLENFAGCAVVISHDRWFLDRICTHILAFEGDSQVYFFEGSFSDYEENKKKRLGGDLIPKRIKYKKLIR